MGGVVDERIVVRPRASTRGSTGWFPLGTGARSEAMPIALVAMLSVAILGVDLLLKPGRSVNILFVLVIIVAGAMRGPRFVMATVLLACAATLGGYVLRHGWMVDQAYAARRLFCLVAVAATGLLVIRNQTTLRRRRELAALLDLSGDAMFVRGIDGRITWWNRWAEQLYGWTSWHVLGQAAATVLGDRGATAELTRPGVWEGEVRHRRSDGRQIHVLTRRMLRTDLAGRPVGYLETNTDISQERATAVALRRSEDRHRQIFWNSGAAICELDLSATLRCLETLRGLDPADRAPPLRHALAQLVVVDANETALSLMQASGKEQLQEPLSRMLVAGATTLLAGLLAPDAETPAASIETTVTTLRGEPRTVLLSITVPTPAFPNLVLCMIDVTEQRRAEAGLRLAQEELALAARVATLGELTASIAQDVERPIAAIGRHAQTGLALVRLRDPEFAPICRSIERIVGEGRHAAEIITGLRQFLVRAEPSMTALDLNDVIRAAVDLTRHEIADRHVALQLDLAPGPQMVEGDRGLLLHVAVTLILNGIRSMHGIAAQDRRLTIGTGREGEELLLSVRDCGTLCPSLGIEGLFDPLFTAGPNGSRRDIGLAVCRASVHAHAGRIWATASDPVGTVIRVALPRSGPAALVAADARAMAGSPAR